MDVLLFCHTQTRLRFPCHANVSLFVQFRGWANITHKIKESEEIASVHFNGLFSAWFICTDLKKNNLLLIYEDLQERNKQMSGS